MAESLHAIYRIAPTRKSEVRARTDAPSEVYRDARIVLATYPSGRPRVVLEAHHNGIPVIGLDQPALAEVVGPAGVLLGQSESPEAWLKAVAELWDDGDKYDQLVVACRAWADREGIRPEAIVDRFESLIERVAGGGDA